MPQWGKCDPIEVSIVPGECGPSQVPSEATGGNPPAERNVSTIGETGFVPNAFVIIQVSSTIYPIEAMDDMFANGWFDEDNSYVDQHHTSTIYPTEIYEDMTSGGPLEGVSARIFTSTLEEMACSGTVTSASLVVVLQTYSDWPVEEMESNGELLSVVVNIVATYRTYTMEIDNVATDGQMLYVDLQGSDDYLSYTNWPVENINCNGQFLSGALS